MESALKAFEVAGTIDDQQQLHLDAPLPIAGPSRVRVIVLVPEEADVEEKEWYRVAAANLAFGFLKEPSEDIYTLADGKMQTPVSNTSDRGVTQ